jgi:hypothetical protein
MLWAIDIALVIGVILIFVGIGVSMYYDEENLP